MRIAVVGDVGGHVESLGSQPAQWIQLIGNHETNYLQPPVFAWPESLSRKHIRIIKR